MRVVDVNEAVALLEQGHLVVHPTEGVYGIAADAYSAVGLDRIEALKGRVAGRGWVLVASTGAGARAWLAPDPLVQLALEHPWSGPVTVIARAAVEAPRRVVAADGFAALRIDRHPVVASLGARLLRPWVTTSLNDTGQPPCHDVTALPLHLVQALAAVCDGPPRPRGRASTLIRWDAGRLTVVRAGDVTPDELRAVLGEVG